ncbi:hypothetical protein LCGC14_0788600 [marine sediment metagenome]|uniref:Uncharacterized protein n=1 Tax=marine sediment metagenome TaxID=412755 RepID=A0A0F9PXG4_9ZZZZ
MSDLMISIIALTISVIALITNIIVSIRMRGLRWRS